MDAHYTLTRYLRVMAMLTYSYPAMLIPWTILYTVCKDVGYKKGDTFPAFMVLGIGVAAQMGFTALPIKSHSLLSLGILESVTHGEYSINFFEYAAINIPITLVVLIIYILMMRFVFKVNVDLLYEITEEKFSSYRNQKLTLQKKSLSSPSYSLSPSWRFRASCRRNG